MPCTFGRRSHYSQNAQQALLQDELARTMQGIDNVDKLSMTELQVDVVANHAKVRLI